MNEALHLSNVQLIPKKLNFFVLILRLRPFLLYKNIQRIRTIHLHNNGIESISDEESSNDSDSLEDSFMLEDSNFKVQTFYEHIESIDLSNNAIKDLDLVYVSPMTNLEILNASHNQIFTFKPANVSHLRVLDLSKNKITRLTGIKETSLCHTLEVLLLNDNCISEKDSLTDVLLLTALNTLDIRNNPIDDNEIKIFCDIVKDKCPCIWLLNGEMMIIHNYEDNAHNKTAGIDLSPIQPERQHVTIQEPSIQITPITPISKDILHDSKLLANLTAFAEKRSKKKEVVNDTNDDVHVHPPTTLIEREIEKMRQRSRKEEETRESTKEKLREKAKERMREKLGLSTK
jgi:hypothetical protein